MKSSLIQCIVAVLLITTCSLEAQLFFPAEVVVPGGMFPKTIATGDLNSDGHDDMAVAYGRSAVFIYLGNGDTTFQGPVLYSAGSNPDMVHLSDLDNDGDLDIALTSGGDIAVLAGNGDGTFQEAALYDVNGYPSGVAINDFNGDGILDLAVVNWHTPTYLASLFFGNGDCTFQDPVDIELVNRPNAVVTGDLNNDSIPDLAVVIYVGNDVLILLGNGDGTFIVADICSVNISPWDIAIGDLDEDGHLDLAVVHMASSDIAVLIGNGDGTFQPGVDYYGGGGSASILIDDLNGDHHLDLINIRTSSNRVIYLLGRGDGTFEPFDYCFTEEHTLRAATIDADGDSHLDLVVTQSAINAVAILINTTDTTISADLTCNPSSGTLPFTTNLSASFCHDFFGESRYIAARLDLHLAGGGQITGWREGEASVPYGSIVDASWNQYLPGLQILAGDNIFELVAEDVTSTPYNQTPFLPSGQTDSAMCVVTGMTDGKEK